MSKAVNQDKVNAFSKALAAALQLITGKPSQPAGRDLPQHKERKKRSTPKTGRQR